MCALVCLWVFFHKGSSASGRDMSRNDVWDVAESLGMRPLGLVSIVETWTAFRFKQATGQSARRQA
jgi:hypothetical protein